MVGDSSSPHPHRKPETDIDKAAESHVLKDNGLRKGVVSKSWFPLDVHCRRGTKNSLFQATSA